MNKVIKKLSCSMCNRCYKTKKVLLRHQRIKHNIFKRSATSDYSCAHCDENFTAKRKLSCHIQTIHLHKEKKKLGCRLFCPQCPDSDLHSFRTYHELRAHLNEKHEAELLEENYRFEDETDFETWKKQIEEKNSIKYVRDTAIKKMSWGTRSYMICHRSYCARLIGNRTRSLKKIGSNKTGRACPSTMTVTMEENAISVKYYPVHIGHDCEIRRLNLPSEEKYQIAEKLAAGVTFQCIMDEIRNNKSESECKRKYIIGRRDLHNIVRDYNILKYATKLHANDAISVKMWIEKLFHEKGKNSVLYFKLKGATDTYRCNEEVPCISLKRDDFCIVIMTPFQEEMFLKFGTDKICVDGTHGMNEYNFFLFTVFVCDEFGNGIPVAHCFSNRRDSILFSLFFWCLRATVGVITASVFMSDDEVPFYNAWTVVMGPVSHQLLCSWHVLRNWRKNLDKLENNEKKSLVVQSLNDLMETTEETKFYTSLNAILVQLYDDEDTEDFCKYFDRFFACRVEKWAHCFRLRFGANTNTYLENVGKVLEYIHLESKKCKRLDYAIYILLKLARDAAYGRKMKLLKQTRAKIIQKIIEAHQRSFNITKIRQKVEKNNKWVVTSERFEKDTYEVEKLIETNDCGSCNLKCEECNICVHAYTCTCNNNLIHFNVCKHIHACVRKCTDEKIVNVSLLSDAAEVKFPVPETSSSPHESPPNEIAVMKCATIMDVLKSESVPMPVVSKLMKNLDASLSLLKEENQTFHVIDKSEMMKSE